jgi:electron transfer flavoprotein alpha subunit
VSSIFIFSENSVLAAQLVSLGNALGEPVQAVCYRADDAAALANTPLQCVHVLQGASPRPEDYAAALAALIRQEDTSLLLIGDTIRGRELAAKTAAILDVGFVSGASQVERAGDKIATARMQYGGAIIKNEQIEQLTVVTVPAGKYPAPEMTGRPAPIVKHEVETPSPIRQIELKPIERHGESLDKSKVVIGVGLGFNQKQDLALADELAKTLHAAIGCTRPVADDKKWLPNEQYIGISGATIHPDLYVAVGISGQIQHTVGVREAKIVVAINKNEKAPIFKAADFGIVGDLYQILPLLIKSLSRSSG